MLDWLKKERCSACNDERAVRYCLRRNKEIGWRCCNGYRSDRKCPESCPYTPKADSGASPLPQVKSDSRAEFMDFLERYLHFWIHTKVSSLQDNTPRQLSDTEQGREVLSEWLSGFSYPDGGVLVILNRHLGLNLPVPKQVAVNPETIAENYLDAVIAADWDNVLAYHNLPSDASPGLITLLVGRLSSHPLLRKVKKYGIINAGFTEDHRQSFVFCELNGSGNLTFIFVAEEGRWNLHQVICGTLQDYYAQKNIFRDIAVAIVNKDETTAGKLLPEADKRYPLCADIQYYYGQYYAGLNKTAEARHAFELASVLEPSWQEPVFRLAMLYLNEKNYSAALSEFMRLNEQSPDDINVLNNLGVCYLGLGDKQKARQIWSDALKHDSANELLKKNLERLDIE